MCLTFLGVFVLSEELVHPFKALFLRFCEVDLKQITAVRFGEVEEKAARVV